MYCIHFEFLHTACWIYWQTGRIESGLLDMCSLMVKNSQEISNVPLDMLFRFVLVNAMAQSIIIEAKLFIIAPSYSDFFCSKKIRLHKEACVGGSKQKKKKTFAIQNAIVVLLYVRQL